MTLLTDLYATGYQGATGPQGATGVGATGPQGPSGTIFKSSAIEYPEVESILLFYVDTGLQINKLIGTVNGTGANTTFSIYYGTTALVSGTQIVVGGTNVTTASNQVIVTSFNNAVIPSGNFVWVTVSATTNTDWLNINMQFTLS